MNKNIIKFNRTIKEVKVISDSKIILKANLLSPNQIEQRIEQEKINHIKLTEQEFNEKAKELYQQGFNDGVKQQKRDDNETIQQRFRLLDKISEEVSAANGQLLESCEKYVVKLAIETAQKIVNSEILVNSDIIIDIVKAVFKKMSDVDSKIIVRVNPLDRDILFSKKDELIGQKTHLNNVDIQADNRITRGGCFIESDFSTIDATIETQFEEVERTMLKELETNE